MNKIKTLLVLFGALALLFLSGVSQSNNSGSAESKIGQKVINDGENRNGNNLKKVKIGSQIWAAQNLTVSYFKNGDIIPEAKTDKDWFMAGEEKNPVWCFYLNDSAYCKKFGKLYNWYAVNDPRGLLPDGWHIPSNEEWTVLLNYLGGKTKAGVKMKSNQGWKENGNGTNFSGFTGLPGGYRSTNGVFYDVYYYGSWWSSTESGLNCVWAFGLGYNYSGVDCYSSSEVDGLSVRCIAN